METPGERLRVARQAAGVSLNVMALRTSYSKPYLSQLETGKRAVAQEHVRAYERVLGVSLDRDVSRVGQSDVDLLAQATDFVTAVGLRHGGMAAADMARSQWQWAQGLLNQSMTDVVRLDLQDQAARLADRVAWSQADAGRADHATRIYEGALDLAVDGRETRAVVMVNLADHWTRLGKPGDSLALLGDLKTVPDVLDFTAHSARALAYSTLGDWQSALRHIGLADEAHARVDLKLIPDTHKPYASGHSAHAHRAAGKSLFLLARKGYRKATPLAVERLTQAVELFGPERARAIARCQAQLELLAG